MVPLRWKVPGKRLFGAWTAAADPGSGESDPRLVGVAALEPGVKSARRVPWCDRSPGGESPVAGVVEVDEVRQGARPGLDRNKGASPAEGEVRATAAVCPTDLAGVRGSQLG